MIICQRCIQAIRSRGEKVVIDEEIDNEIAEEDGLVCEWCDEPASELCSVHFPG